MSLTLQNSTNLAIQLRSIFSEELPLLAQLGENWWIYGLGRQLRAIRTFNNTEALAFPTTDPDIVPAAGPDTVIMPTSAIVRANTTAGAYSLNGGSNNLSIGFGAGTTNDSWFVFLPDDLLTIGADWIVPFHSGDSGSGADLINGTNAPLKFRQNGTDNTGGASANTVTVIVDFTVLQL